MKKMAKNEIKREELKVEFRSQQELEDLAIEFHSKRKEKKFPFNVEAYLNLKFKYHIQPCPRLEAGCNIDTALIACLNLIRIDEKIYNNQYLRARFSLSHELAHLILHKNIIDKLVAALKVAKKTDEFKSIIAFLPVKDHGWAEWQAQFFGGCLLAPKDVLKERLESAIKERLKKSKYGKLDGEDRSIICHDLASYFEITKEAMIVRIGVAGLDFLFYMDLAYFGP